DPVRGPTLRSHLAGPCAERQQEQTKRWRREQGKQGQVLDGVLSRESPFETRNAPANGFGAGRSLSASAQFGTTRSFSSGTPLWSRSSRNALLGSHCGDNDPTTAGRATRSPSRDTGEVYIARAFVQKRQFLNKIAQIAQGLPPQVISVTSTLGSDWAGEPAVYFQVV
ncbi:hypothetical protein B4Q13_25520, partial [Lacticaseibacillus rhamnosus]